MKRLKSLQSPAVPPGVGDDEKEVWVSYNWLPLSACDSSYLGTDRLAFDSWALITESGLAARSIREPHSCQSYKRGSASPPYITGKLTIIGTSATKVGLTRRSIKAGLPGNAVDPAKLGFCVVMKP